MDCERHRLDALSQSAKHYFKNTVHSKKDELSFVLGFLEVTIAHDGTTPSRYDAWVAGGKYRMDYEIQMENSKPDET